MANPFTNDWASFFEEESQKPYYQNLRAFLKEEYASRKIFPPMGDIFNAMRYTALADVKAVILGQDPYINAGEAHGMAFSVLQGVNIPPSLQNIYKEIYDDTGAKPPAHGCLIEWAKRGVLLLNRVLTVRAGASKSHAGRGWEEFTSAVIRKVNDKETPVVFLLWGRDAQTALPLITNGRHLALAAPHPSPLARGAFFGCKHFSKANEFLSQNGIEPIDWQLSRILT